MVRAGTLLKQVFPILILRHIILHPWPVSSLPKSFIYTLLQQQYPEGCRKEGYQLVSMLSALGAPLGSCHQFHFDFLKTLLLTTLRHHGLHPGKALTLTAQQILHKSTVYRVHSLLEQVHTSLLCDVALTSLV